MVLLPSGAQNHNELEGGINSLGAFLPDDNVSLSEEQQCVPLCET